MQISGSVFVVTGGASGLGEATARALIAQQGQVIVADLSDANSLTQQLGERARFIKTDVTSEASAKAAVAFSLKEFGALHGLINCAGVAIAQKVLGKEGVHSLETFARVLAVNATGSFNMLRLASETMARNEPNAAGERGVIISVASVAAFDGQIGQAAYAASKGAIAAMTLPVARELARWGIRVMTIAPGLFDTPLFAGLAPEARASLEQSVPFPPRLGRPEEFASLVTHIIENEMLNGEVIRLDGALRMAPK
jgi:NAD(P)-dependent dehydrogenase (short-subunit alcohol dehydrogenase family)